MKIKLLGLSLLTGASMLIGGCSKDGSVNIFSLEDDKTLGLQTKEQIEANPSQFPIMPPSQYPAAYEYIYSIRNEILASGQVTHKDDFVWEVKLIKDDNTLNAFCTPGGYIYVYTGLIKYLDSKSALAGVMGHEMAHADRRHSTNQMTKRYGVQTLLDVVLGKNQGLVSQIASELVSLRFSRTDETDADAHSVQYLCPTKYHADGAAEFFEKIEQSGGSNVPEFLSTHPSPDNRVKNIQDKAVELNCGTTISNTENDTEYRQFKNSL
ncbi:MAG: peptidase M48 [Bacteroidetes bacterium 47-18]|nr:MAG: peptidase M48 [Bacteroidetes bacterium 47-18]